MHMERTENHWLEILLSAFDLGLSDPLNVDWLLDRAETGEWSGH